MTMIEYLIKLWKSLLFLAPEKVAGESVGVAADIWGVGVLAFILWVLKKLK